MVTRLSGGLTPADGSDPRTFPAIFNDAADIIEANESDIDALEGKNIPAFGTAAPSDGDALVYNDAEGVYEPGEGGAGSLEDLTDTEITTPVAGDSLVYDGTDWLNGPRSGNAIINGDFGVWQRGTSFTTLVDNTFTADRWNTDVAGGAGTLDEEISRELFAPGDLEAIGYGDADYFLRYSIADSGNRTRQDFRQKIEDVRTFAGQQVTFSFWAKTNSATTVNVFLSQNFGSGGSTNVGYTLDSGLSLTTSWQRFNFTTTLGGLSGKTIGSGSSLLVGFRAPNPVTSWQLDLWGVQLEAGPVATPFKLAGGGSKAAELALCQRYYYREEHSGNRSYFVGFCQTSTDFRGVWNYPVTMRVKPTISFGTLGSFVVQSPGNQTPSSLIADNTQVESVLVKAGVTGQGAGNGGQLLSNGPGAFIAADAEL